MTTQFLTQFNYNKGKAILSTPFAYQAFKSKIESVIKEKKECMDDCGITPTPDVPYIKVGDIAILDFKGFTVNSCSELEEIVYGCISLQDFCEDLQLAIADESINKVVINFDSGGGYTMYVQETAELVKQLAAVKPIYAYTSGLMCSAAYKVACNCTNIIASPTSLVGSIGVYCEYMDVTKAMADEGIVVKTFQGGSKKTIGSPYISLTPEQEKEIQDDINKEWEAFKAMVKSNRGAVSEDFMQGQPFSGTEAIELGTNLTDGTINSLKEFLKLISQSND